MGNPQRVDAIVFSLVNKRRWFWRKHVCCDLSSYKGWCILWSRKGKKKKSSKES